MPILPSAEDLYFWVQPERAAIEEDISYRKVTQNTFRNFDNGISPFDGALLLEKHISIDRLARSTTSSTFHVIARLGKWLLDRHDVELILCHDPIVWSSNSDIWLTHALVKPAIAGCIDNGSVSKSQFIRLLKKPRTLLAAEAEIVFGEDLVKQLMMSNHSSWGSLQKQLTA